MTYTVYFPPPRIRRNNFLSWAGAIFCAGSVSIVAAVAAPHDPIDDTAVIAGPVGHLSRLPASTTSSDQFLCQHHETSRRETGATGFFIVSTRALALVPILTKSPYRDTEPIDRRNPRCVEPGVDLSLLRNNARSPGNRINLRCGIGDDGTSDNLPGGSAANGGKRNERRLEVAAYQVEGDPHG